MSAATLFPLERRTRCRFGDDEQILQVERGVPARVVLTVATHAHARRASCQGLDAGQRLLHLMLRAHDAHEILHVFLQRLLDLIGAVRRGRALEGRERCFGGRLYLAFVRDRAPLLARELCGVFACPLTEY